MKKLLLFFSLLLSLLPLSAAAETYTWTITGSESLKQAATSTITLNSVTWDINQTSFGTSLFAQRSGTTGLLFGSSNNKVKEIAFSATAPFAGKTIKKVTSTALAKTANAITITLKIDDNEIEVSNKLTTASATYTFDDLNITCSKNVALVYSQPSATSNSVTISGISIEYEDAPSGPVDFEYTLPATKEIEEGEMFDLGLPEKRPTNITWESDKPEVAVIEDGIIYAYAEGTANIKMTWAADDNFNASSEDGQTIAVTVTKPLAAETPVIKYNGEVVDGDEIEVKYNSELSVESANATYIKIEKTGSAPVVIEGNKGTFVADVEEIYTITAIGKGGNAEKVIMISFLKAGMPTITINGKQIENNCFYNVTENIPALISAENAVSYTILAPNAGEVDFDDNGSFTITSTGEYLATASNGVDDSDTFSFTIGKLLEQKTETPSEPTEYVWKKVSDTNDFDVNVEYIIVAKGTNSKGTNYSVALSNVYKDKNRAIVEITVDENNEISELPNEAMIFTLNYADNYYNWFATNYHNEDGTETTGYLGAVKTQNQLNILQNTGEGTQTSVTFNEGNAKIRFVNCDRTDKNNNVFERFIGYNSTNDPLIFNAYATGETDTNQPVQLYKKTGLTPNPVVVYEVVEYLPEITAEGHLTFTNDEVAKVLKFESKIEGVRFHHCTEKNAPAQKSMHKAPQAATWTELINGEYSHSDNENGTHIWVKALKDSSVNEATIESPEFWQFITPEGTTTGIESVAAEAEGECELYNLQGVRIDRRSAAPGLYIERRGGKAVKVIL